MESLYHVKHFMVTRAGWQRKHDDDSIVDKFIHEENRLVTLNPLGHRPIIDIDELHNRNRRSTDDPYIKATMSKEEHGTNTKQGRQ